MPAAAFGMPLEILAVEGSLPAHTRESVRAA